MNKIKPDDFVIFDFYNLGINILNEKFYEYIFYELNKNVESSTTCLNYVNSIKFH